MANGRIANPTPPSYSTPSFPSLYWPFRIRAEAFYLYYLSDIWRFTLYWTLIVYGACHLAAGGYAVAMQTKNWKFIWVVPLVYALIGGLEALLAGSMVGLILGAVFNAGYFRMSTWIPFVWGLINTLVLILSAFSIQGGL